jgi:hypothetical protein
MNGSLSAVGTLGVERPEAIRDLVEWAHVPRLKARGWAGAFSSGKVVGPFDKARQNSGSDCKTRDYRRARSVHNVGMTSTGIPILHCPSRC